MVRYKEKLPPPFIVRLHSIYNSLTLTHPEQHKGSESYGQLISLSVSPSSNSCVSSFPWTVAPARSLLQWGVSTELQGTSICTAWNPAQAAVLDVCFTITLHGLQWEMSMGCRNISALAPETLLSLLHWLSCLWGDFSHLFLFTLFSHRLCHAVFCLFSRVFPEGITSSAAGTARSVQHGAAPGPPSQRPTL